MTWRTATLLTAGVGCLVIAAASFGVLVEEISFRLSDHPFVDGPHFEVIAPVYVGASPGKEAKFSIRLEPKHIQFNTIVEIFTSCDCLATGERSKISRNGELLIFDLVAKSNRKTPRTWQVHFSAREHSDSNSLVVGEIPVIPATVSISSQVEEPP